MEVVNQQQSKGSLCVCSEFVNFNAVELKNLKKKKTPRLNLSKSLYFFFLLLFTEVPNTAESKKKKKNYI